MLGHGLHYSQLYLKYEYDITIVMGMGVTATTFKNGSNATIIAYDESFSPTSGEYDQEITQSQSSDRPTAPQGRDTVYKEPHYSKNTIKN